MASTLSTAAKTAAMTAIRDYFANGSLELLAANNTPLATFGLSTAGGSIANDTWTLAFDSSTVQGLAAAGTGTNATKAQVKTAGGTAGLTGLTVGASGSGADIEFDNVNIATGQNVILSSATLQYSA